MTNIDLADAIENRASFCIGAIDTIHSLLSEEIPLPDEAGWLLIESMDKMREIRAMATKELTGHDIESTEEKTSEPEPETSTE